MPPPSGSPWLLLALFMSFRTKKMNNPKLPRLHSTDPRTMAQSLVGDLNNLKNPEPLGRPANVGRDGKFHLKTFHVGF